MRSTSNDSASPVRPPGRALLAGLALAGLAAVPSAQRPRDPVDLQPGIAGVGSALAIDSDGDLTVAVWVDEVQLQVLSSVSDGRGTSWTAPLRVDRSPHFASGLPVTFLDSTGVFVAGSNVYVTWRELDFSTGQGQVLFARSTDGGASFGPELVLDDGVPGTATSPRAVTAVSPDPGGDHVYVLRIDSGPSFGLLAPRVVASHDGGASFGAAVPITTNAPTGFTSKDPNVYGDGLDVHVVWSEDTPAPDRYEVYYQRSTDGGLTWLDDDVLVSKGLGQLSDEPEARLAVGGSKFLVTYVATSTVTGADELRSSLSLDGGGTWTRGTLVSGVPTGFEISGPSPLVTQGGNLVVAWEDDRSGAPTVYRSTSLVGGSGFSAPDALWTDSGLGGFEARIEAPASAGEPDTVLIAFDGGDDGGSDGRVPAIVSTDGGATFWPAVELDSSTTGDADYVELAYDARYDNYLAVWRADGGGVEAVRAGGLRPQTVEAIGLVGGGTGQLEFRGFAAPAGGPKFAWALAADGPGSFQLPLMDGRLVGLAVDSTLLATLQEPLLFSALIDPSGSGATPGIDISAPPGTTFTLAAVSLSLGPLRLEELTDAFEVTVQ